MAVTRFARQGLVTTQLWPMIAVNHADLAGRQAADAPQVVRDVPALVVRNPTVAPRVQALVTLQAPRLA